MAEQSSNSWNEGGGTGAAAGGSDSSQQTMGELKEKVASVADAQKDRAAEGLGGIADAARQTGEGLRSQNETLASWVNAASDQLRHMADRLRDRPAAELVDDLSRFARERPAVFIGGAFLLGLGVARLLKSSPHRAWQGGNADPRYPYGGRMPREARPGGPGAPNIGAY